MKKLFKIVATFATVLFLSVFTGCMSMVPISEHSVFPADGQKYEILGRVTVNTSQTRSGYSRLMEAAKEQYPNADDVVNITVDAKKTTILFFFHSYKYVMSGVAIDYK